MSDEQDISNEKANENTAMLEAPEVHHHHSNKHGVMHWFEIVMSASVLMLSAGSLYIALHTGHTMEQLVSQNQRLVEANSLPLLMVDHGNAKDDGSPELTMELSNRGVGPARIAWFAAKYAGHEYANAGQLIDALTPVDLAIKANRDAFFGLSSEGVPRSGIYTSKTGGRLMTAGEEVNFFTWPKPDASLSDALAAWKQLDQVRGKIDFSVCYCSIFDRCWIDELDASTPREIKNCSAEKHVDLKG